jgi:hypothetical protein
MMVQSMVLNMSQISFAAVVGWAESSKAPGQRCKRLQAWIGFVNAFWTM